MKFEPKFDKTTIKKEKPAPIKEITGTSPEGEEIKFELSEQLAHWNQFFKDTNIDWVEFPKEIRLTESQVKEMKRLIEEFGFNKMIIIPKGLTDTPDKYDELANRLRKCAWTDKYIEKHPNILGGGTFQSLGNFRGLKNKSEKIRIILTKLDNFGIYAMDDLFALTEGKTLDELEGKDGIFKKKGLKGLDVATYMIMQIESWKDKHIKLDKGLGSEYFGFLSESYFPGSDYVIMGGVYNEEIGGNIFNTMSRLHFYAQPRDARAGSRLAGIFEIES